LSTIAVFITRSIDCTVVACKSQWPRRGIPGGRGGWGGSYINNATEGADRIRAEDHVGAAAGILHDGARDHDDVLGGAGQLLDHQVNHLAETGILILEELRDAEEERRGLVGRELLARVEEEGNLGEENAASSRLDRGAVEESSCAD
jgi:hypothetical protein